VAVERDDWRGAFDGRRPTEVELRLDTVLGPSEGGGSGSFPGLASDGVRWYVKPQTNAQGGRVIVTEYIVSAAGRIIDAPVCEVAAISIPSELAGYEPKPGVVLEEGVASASRGIDAVVEDRGLLYRERDDNQRRHAGVLALYDWCWGGDPQWLYVETQDGKLYSHDHGWYLPPEGPTWDEASLLASAGDPHELGHPSSGLDPAEIDRLADALAGVTRDALVLALEGVPTVWPASDSDLEAVGYFLERRAEDVASRMRGRRARI
jgi:hypothetical protein